MTDTAPPRAVLVAVDDDDAARTHLVRELRRYEDDYDVIVCASADEAMTRIDALAEAGADAGLPADQAARFALATVQGSATLAAAADESPRALADRVASPGGSTRKGLDVLDEDGGLNPLIRNTLTAAILRNREMAEAAR